MGAFNINQIHIGVVIDHPEAIVPVKSVGNVGIDLHCVSDKNFVEVTLTKPPKQFGGETTREKIKAYYLQPGERYLFSTGIRLNIPSGYAIIFKDRSGNASRSGLHVLGGVIDSNYTGELKVVLLNTSENEVCIQVNDRICQMVIVEDHDSAFVEIPMNQLKNTDRGDKGFGSSGK